MNEAINRVAELWHRFTTSRYTQRLEDEVDRLQAENRALLNSLLTRAGVQPIDPVKPIGRTSQRLSRHQRQVDIERRWVASQPKSDA